MGDTKTDGILAFGDEDWRLQEYDVVLCVYICDDSLLYALDSKTAFDLRDKSESFVVDLNH